MAFSTQKDFMQVGFMNSSLEAVSSKKAPTLKTYPSSTDTRAWSLNNKKQANFFADIVACRTYVPYSEGNEKSNDVDNIKDIKQLQDIINNLKKENAVLRNATSEAAVKKGDKTTNTITDNKSCMIPISEYNKIVAERNKLNEQLAKMVGLEDKIGKLKQRAMDADKLEEQLITSNGQPNEHENNLLRSQVDDLNNQCSDCQREIQDMQKQLREVYGLKQENCRLTDEVKILTHKVECLECLEEKLCLAEHQIYCNEHIIQDYEYQFNQLMMVIEELEGKPSSSGYCNCDANKTAMVKDGHLKDLTLATKATIDQIKLEMCARGKLQEEIRKSKIELARLKDKTKTDIDEIRRDRDDIVSEASDKYADILTQLKKCREENAELKKFMSEVKSGLFEETGTKSEKDLGEVDEKQCKEKKPSDSEMNYMSEVEVSESGLEKADEEKPMHNRKIPFEIETTNVNVAIRKQAGDDKTGPGIADGGNRRSGGGKTVPGADGGKTVPGMADNGKTGEKATDSGQKIGPEIADDVNTGPGIADGGKRGPVIADDDKAGPGISDGGKTGPGITDSSRTELADGGKRGPGIADGNKRGPGSDTKTRMDGDMFQIMCQCLKALEVLKKDLREAQDKVALEKSALEKNLAEKQKLKDQLEEENEKYKFQRQKAKELHKENADLESKKGDLQNKLTFSQEALIKQKEILGHQNELLYVSKGELEKHRGELIKSKEQIALLEALNKSAEDEKKKLSDDLKAKQQEIFALNDKIKEYMDKVSKVEEKMKAGDSGTKTMANDLANLKKTIATLNEQMVNKEAVIKEANNKINAINSEKESLKNEIKQNRKDLTDIQALVGDIEAQRGKNIDLEALVKNYENKLNDVGKSITCNDDANLQDAINQMKKQLELSESNNNKLASKLKKSKDELENMKLQSGNLAPGVASTSTSGVTGYSSARKSQSPNKMMATAAGDAKASCITSGLSTSSRSMAGVNSAVKQHLKSLEKRHSKSLLKLQTIYGDQMKNLAEDHEKEIQALKECEQNMHGNLKKENMKKFNETGTCTCKKSFCEMTKLQRICHKIIDKGIGYLTVKELTHLHADVYKAGIRLKPELLKHCDEKQKCCKCTDFSCCLPPLSKEMEKKLISRIIFLEHEVDKANKILLHLKNKYSSNYSPDTYKFNDDLNDLLKTFCPDTYQKTSEMRCISCADLNNQYSRKCKSARLLSKQRKQCDIPTRD